MMDDRSSKIFKESVTHLITTEVGSPKYHVSEARFFFVFGEKQKQKRILENFIKGRCQHENTNNAARMDK
jgi:hypothetical protein